MRLFIATTFPDDVLRLLSDRIVPVRPKLPPASWVRPETQHLTFAFLGEQPESLVDRLSPLLTSRLANVARFEAMLRGCGFFPNPRHARGGGGGAEPEGRFGGGADAGRGAGKEAGVELDRSGFRPHPAMKRVGE